MQHEIYYFASGFDNRCRRKMKAFSPIMSMYSQTMSSSNTGGGAPTVLWDVLKGKKVKTNDGKELGEIKEFSRSYVRVEKGTIRKESFWIPKYIADAYDGKILWLLLGEQEVRERYQYGEKEGEFKEAPTTDQYATDLETFKSTPAGKKREYPSDLEESIRLVEDYDNIRKYS